MNENEETRTRFTGEWTHPAAERLQEAWFAAIAMDYKIPEAVRKMQGMSGKKFRYLLNRLVEYTPDARYLEIGSWSGSTACSAVYGNKGFVTCIDNWEHFGGPREAFIQNVQACINQDITVNLIENDFRKVDYTQIGHYNIYMYDGPHALEDQYDGVMIAQPALDNVYTLIVDDWNQANDVQAGTHQALKELGHRVLASIEIITASDANISISHEQSDWHNGYFLAVIEKT